jgi:hypothetical protein
MDPIKQRIIELIDAERYRITKHFADECRADRATREDAIKAIRTGTIVEVEKSASERGSKYRFHGIDLSDRKAGVVVSLDESQNRIGFITFFVLRRR